MWDVALLIYFHENFNYQVYGIDTSEKACELSQENLRIAGVPSHIICADIFNSACKRESFDIIFSGGMVEYFKNPYGVLSAMVELLKMDGILITGIPNLSNIVRFFQKAIDRETFDTHYNITPEDFRELYRSLGLEEIAIGYCGGFDLLSIDWNRLKPQSRLWRNFGVRCIGKINALVVTFLKALQFELELKSFSPDIIAIGRKR